MTSQDTDRRATDRQQNSGSNPRNPPDRPGSLATVDDRRRTFIRLSAAGLVPTGVFQSTDLATWSAAGGDRASSADQSSLTVTNAFTTRSEAGWDSVEAAENVWIIGDWIRFLVTVRNEGDSTFEGSPEFFVDFVDDPDEGVVDADWDLQAEAETRLHRITCSPSSPLRLAPGESASCDVEMELTDQIDRIKDDFKPSLAYTDRVRVGLVGAESNAGAITDDDCSPSQSLCVHPEGVQVRPGIFETGTVALAVVAALAGVLHLRKLGRAVQSADRILMTAEMASYFSLAMADYRRGDHGEMRIHVADLLGAAGLGRSDAEALSRDVIGVIEGGDDGDVGRVGDAALNLANDLAQSGDDLEVDLETLLPQAFAFLVGDLGNLGDVVPGMIRTVTTTVLRLGNPLDAISSALDGPVEPHRIAGTVKNQSGEGLGGVTVNVYSSDPRDARSSPFASTTTDADGAFRTAEVGPDHPSLLWFDLRRDGSSLTSRPITRSYRPDGYIPGEMTYRLPVFEGGVVRPGVDVELDVVEATRSAVRFRVTYRVTHGRTDVMDWGHSGGVHVRVPKGTVREVGLGDFDDRFAANHRQEEVSNLSDATYVELATAQSNVAGTELETGEFVVEPSESADDLTIGYQSWGWDAHDPVSVEGTPQNYVARAPTGPTYNRHRIDPGYTFVNYPVRTEQVRLQGSREGEEIDGVLQVRAVEDGPKITYAFTVDGDVTFVSGTDRNTTDANDGRVDHGDGRVTVNGVTGNGYGDSFRVDGRLDALQVYTDAENFRLFLDDEELPAGDYDSPGEKLFQVHAIEDGPKFSYEFTVDGDVAKVEHVGDGSADRNDSIRENGDGTHTVTGVTGNGYADSYRVKGQFTDLSVDAADENYRLNLAGTRVSQEDLL